MAYSSRLLLYIDCFRQTLNTFLFEQYSAHRAHQRCLFSDDAVYKSTLTLLQTSEGEYAVVVVKTHKTSPDVSCWDFVMCSSSGCVCTRALSSRCRQFSRRELRLAVRHCRWVRSAKYRTVLICCACVCVCVCRPAMYTVTAVRLEYRLKCLLCAHPHPPTAHSSLERCALTRTSSLGRRVGGCAELSRPVMRYYKYHSTTEIKKGKVCHTPTGV